MNFSHPIKEINNAPPRESVAMMAGLDHGYREPASSKPKTRRIDAANSRKAPRTSSRAKDARENLSRSRTWRSGSPW